jgi:hypothetical protein
MIIFFVILTVIALLGIVYVGYMALRKPRNDKTDE